jgi:hypothetical protein
MRAIAWFVALAVLHGGERSMAQPVTVVHRGSFALPTTAVDQHGQAFNLTGLSGITHRGGNLFTAVMDNSNRLVHLDVRLGNDGAIQSANVVSGLTLGESRDFEGIAYTGAHRGSVWLGDEQAPQLREYNIATGALLATAAMPAPFTQIRSGLGWESATLRANGVELWTANEEALTPDGPRASPTAGSVVRLLRLTASGETFVAAEQYAYPVDAWHGGDSPLTTAERSGLVDLVVLPDGRLMALERSLAFATPISPSFQSRIYEIDFSGATNVASVAALSTATYTPVTKRLVWSGAAAGAAGMNLEGMALSPRLAGGHATLIGIVDDGGASDPLSTNTLVSFEVTSDVATPASPGDVDMDGDVDNADFARLTLSYGAQEGALWRDGDMDGNGRVDLADAGIVTANQTTLAEESSAAVPEPSSVALVVLALTAGLAILIACVWRRTASRTK